MSRSGFQSRPLFLLFAATGTLALAGAILCVVAERNLFHATAFGERAAASLQYPGVSRYVGALIADSVIKAKPDLIAVRPMLEATAEGVVTTRPFQAVVSEAARRAHQGAFSSKAEGLLLSLPDLQILVRDALAQVSPEVAAKIPKQVETALARLGDGKAPVVLIKTVQLSHQLRWLWPVLFLAAIGLLIAAVWVAPDRREGLLRCGIEIGIAGLVLVALPPGGAMAMRLIQDPMQEGLAAGLWRSYTADFSTWGLLLIGIGLLFAGGASSLLERVDAGATLRRLWKSWTMAPPSVPLRMLWAVSLLVAGMIAVIIPQQMLAALVLIVGALLAFTGIRELFRLFLEHWAPPLSRAEEEEGTGWQMPVLGILLLAGIGIGAWFLFRNPSVQPVRAKIIACNGFAALCDKRVDEVAFAGAHNAMSNQAVPGWMFPHHEAGLARQLRDGIRALLIDIHAGLPGGTRIKTDMSGEPSAEKMREAVGKEGYEAALRIRNRLVGVDSGSRGIYFCHGFCELGADPVEPEFRVIADFLAANPDEVLLLVIEDYVKPQELAQAFAVSGLEPYVWKGKPDPKWPTLRELIESGGRVIVFIESDRKGVGWIRPAFENIKETPYHFSKQEEFSCRPNRGGEGGTLFQINHWIDTTPTPKPSNAAVVNAYPVLWQRVQQCQQERGHLPNVVAIDFYKTGDLLRVVNELNGIH